MYREAAPTLYNEDAGKIQNTVFFFGKSPLKNADAGKAGILGPQNVHVI